MFLIFLCQKFSMKDREEKRMQQIRRIMLQQQNLWIAAKDSTQMILWELLVCLWKNTEKDLKSSKWMGMCQWGF